MPTCNFVLSGNGPVTGELRAAAGIPRLSAVNCNGAGVPQLASGSSKRDRPSKSAIG